MRRLMLGSLAICCAGATALAADAPVVSVLGVVPEESSRPVATSFDFPPPANLTPIGSYQPRVSNGQLSPIETKPATASTFRSLQPIGHAEPANLPQTATQPSNIPAPRSAIDSAPATSCGDTCDSCGDNDRGRFFGSIDYILFKMRRNPTPGLVQVLPANLADFQANGGDLPPNAATTIFGQGGVDGDARSGVRIHGGVWLDPSKTWGVDASFLQVFQKADSFAITSPGLPVIGRGFIDVGVNQNAFLRYTDPNGLATGSIAVVCPVELYTFDVNLRGRGTAIFNDRSDYLAGVRYLNLRDSVTINSNVAIRDRPGATPFTIQSYESFRATNQFYGGQVGFDSQTSYGCFTFNMMGKFAMGWIEQDVRIEGFAVSGGNQPTQVFPNQSILYVQGTNAGRYSRNRFAVVPELMFQLGYQFTSRLRATVGYDLLTVSSVERSGAAINPGVNPSLTQFIQVRQASNSVQPVFLYGGTDFWAQGLTAGLSFSF